MLGALEVKRCGAVLHSNGKAQRWDEGSTSGLGWGVSQGSHPLLRMRARHPSLPPCPGPLGRPQCFQRRGGGEGGLQWCSAGATGLPERQVNVEVREKSKSYRRNRT